MSSVITSTSRLMLTLLTGTLLSTAVLAQDFDNRANIYGGVTNYNFDSDWNQDDDNGWLLGVETPISERWGLAVERWQFDSDLENVPGSSDFKLTRLGPNFHFKSVNGWQPYAGFGVGQLRQTINSVAGGSSRSLTMDAGLGIKKFVTDNLFLRGDVKLIRVSDVHNWDQALNLSIGYAFGSKSKSAPAPAAPAVAAVAARPDPDTDGDGVVDSRDRCANTPRDLAVDANGCPILEATQVSQQLQVNFDFDKSDIKSDYFAEIANFAQFMTTYGNTSVVIEGHTDSDGADAYNQALSERRAQAVMNRLITAHGIAASRLKATGYGEEKPLVANSSPANKASNRRIMAEVSAEVQEQKKR